MGAGDPVSISYTTMLYLQVTAVITSLLVIAMGIWGIVEVEDERCSSSGGSTTCLKVLTFDPEEGACGGPMAGSTDMFNCWWVMGFYSFMILCLGILMLLSLFRVEFVARHFWTLSTVKGHAGYMVLCMFMLLGVCGQAGIVVGAIIGFVAVTYLLIAFMHNLNMGHPGIRRG